MYTIKGDPLMSYQVKTLGSVYTTKIDRYVTKHSGKDYGKVLKEMVFQIGEDMW